MNPAFLTAATPMRKPGCSWGAHDWCWSAWGEPSMITSRSWWLPGIVLRRRYFSAWRSL